MEWDHYEAALFDLDGVLTPTAEVHMRAWAELFSGFLSSRPGQAPYTDEDYFAHVDGKPRYDGVRDLLAARGIVLPEGGPDDDPSAETVCGLGNRKNAAFTRVLARDGVTPYPGSAALVEDLRRRGTALAVVSSSANAAQVLDAAGLADRVDVLVDGRVARAEHLPGKPAPDTFLRAASALGVDPPRAVVLEDAVSGVQAGHAGGFGLVVGVDRGAGRDVLTAGGADVVVADLEELRP